MNNVILGAGKCDVLLVAMPWPELSMGSIQIAILKPLLRNVGIAAEACSLYLDWMDYLVEATSILDQDDRITPDDYQGVANRYWTVGLGDWIFSIDPLSAPGADHGEYLAYARKEGIPDRVLRVAVRMRELAPKFLAKAADEIVDTACRVVGFTTSFSQNTAALALAFFLKQRNPSIYIVFGGANCDGQMGEALHHSFPWVDVVVRGEAEPVVGDLMCDLLTGGGIRPHAGLCYWQEGISHVIEQTPVHSRSLDQTPSPDYD